MCGVGHQGKRAGPKRQQTVTPALLALCAGVTVCVVAWGYLVMAAIDFGTSARGGTSQAWWFLTLASLGAIACLFVGLMLAARIARRLGISGTAGSGEVPPASIVDPVAMPRPVGGRRAAR